MGMSLSDLARSIDECLDRGDVDTAVGHRSELVHLCQSSRNAHPRGVVLAAQLSLLMSEHSDAASVLSPFVASHQVHLDTIEDIQRQTNAGDAAALAGVVGDFLLGKGRYQEAFEAALHADALFGSRMAVMTEAPPREIVERLWNYARLARIASEGTERWAVADRYLKDCFEQLQRHWGTSLPRLQSLEAFALDIAASLDWARGRIDDSRQKIYRALFLLRGGAVKDTVRLGLALLTAGKIESSLSNRANFRAALDILESGTHTLRSIGHPLASFAELQVAEAYIHAGEVGKAATVLDTLQPKLNEVAHKAEAALAWCWIHARQGDSARAKQAAETMLAFPSLPVRLEAEGHFQLGRALMNLGERKRGTQELHDALDLAQRHGRSKIEIAALLELAADHSGQDPERAREYWEHATELLGRTRSTFLEERRDEVATILRRGWPFFVESDNYKEETRKFSQQFFGRLAKKYGSKSRAAQKAGISRTTVIRLLTPQAPEPKPRNRSHTKRSRT